MSFELKCNGTYRAPDFDLYNGQTTEHLNISDIRKQQMLSDFPDLFEKIEREVEREFVVKTKEDKLEYSTTESVKAKRKK